MIVSVLSLFSGIGLFDLGVLAALEEAGIDAHLTAQVEIDPFCRQVLARHYPNVSREVTDVRDVYPGSVPWSDLFIGGFPCQDVAAPGKQAGLSGERSGLWWQYLRAIDEMRPRGALIENVASGVSRWHGTVCCSLEAVGYRTRTRQISAADVGAPHRRERVFVLAYRDVDGLQGERRERQEGWRPVAMHRCEDMADPHGEPIRHEQRRGRAQGSIEAELGNAREELADADSGRRQGERGSGLFDDERSARGDHVDGCCGPMGQSAGTNDDVAAGWRSKSGMGGGAHGRSARLDAHRWPAGRGQEQHEWEPPRTAHGVANRTARLKALGNAVTPHQGREAMRWALSVLGWP